MSAYGPFKGYPSDTHTASYTRLYAKTHTISGVEILCTQTHINPSKPKARTTNVTS